MAEFSVCRVEHVVPTAFEAELGMTEGTSRHVVVAGPIQFSDGERLELVFTADGVTPHMARERLLQIEANLSGDTRPPPVRAHHVYQAVATEVSGGEVRTDDDDWQDTVRLILHGAWNEALQPAHIEIFLDPEVAANLARQLDCVVTRLATEGTSERGGMADAQG